MSEETRELTYCTKGHFIPSDKLTCPECASKRSDEALYDLQLEFLRKVVSGAAGYTLRVTKSAHKHVLMYTTDSRTFCGQELKVKHGINYEPYDRLSTVCAGCRTAIAGAVHEAMA